MMRPSDYYYLIPEADFRQEMLCHYKKSANRLCPDIESLKIWKKRFLSSEYDLYYILKFKCNNHPIMSGFTAYTHEEIMTELSSSSYWKGDE